MRIYELIFICKPDLPEEDRNKLEEAVQVIDSNHELALGLIDQVVASHPEDSALENYAQRIRNLNDGGAYVLG